MYELYKNGLLNAELLNKEVWLRYLVVTKEKNVNIERVDNVKNISGKEVFEYVMRTLNILENSDIDKKSKKYLYIKEALQWCEVAKCGSEFKRKKWLEKGYPLNIHNLASAEIYLEENTCCKGKDKDIVYTLIKTHGLIGQYIRGEVPISKNKELYDLIKNKKIYSLTKEDLKEILIIFNKCIIEAVDDEIYEKNKNEIYSIIDRIIRGNFKEDSFKLRLKRLLPVFDDVSQGNIQKISPLIKNKEFWYAEAALNDFTQEEVLIIFEKIKKYISINNINIDHISFYKLSKFLYYDYDGNKKINIYKKRVIENFLKDTNNNEHVDFEIYEENNVLMFNFELTPACEKMIDFCVEAERSGLLTYEKSITMLFDLFDLRKDKFDRLNNEEKYLKTMNSIDNSTKKDLIEYVVGNTVVDVGSGGGIMLDVLEYKYPDKNIVGTDISNNVIDFLNKKKKDENRKYDVKIHNFVESKMDDIKPDTIIFSSILHEIYSYTEFNGEKFNIQSVKQALKNAVNSLNDGGRIIIRDGVKTDSNEFVELEFKLNEGMEFLYKFAKDFNGLKDVNNKVRVDLNKLTAQMNINVAREFLYTYTWGQESYAHEVQEQFGYFTLKEFVKFAETELGMKVLVAKEFLEPGYTKHLSPLVTIRDMKGNVVELPNSNLIIVLEK